MNSISGTLSPIERGCISDLVSVNEEDELIEVSLETVCADKERLLNNTIQIIVMPLGTHNGLIIACKFQTVEKLNTRFSLIIMYPFKKYILSFLKLHPYFQSVY